MRAIELLEYDANKLKTLDLSVKKNDSSLPANLSIIQLADYLEKSFKLSGELVFWILYRYVRSNAKWEDVESRIIPGLEKYQKLKNKKKIPSELRDINRIKSFKDFEDLLDKFNDEEVISNKDQEKEIENNFYRTGQAELIYNDNQIKVVVPKTKEASIYFGRNTRWCTAAVNSANYFNDYNRKGPLYIVLIKPLNKRFQFQFEGYDFMDEEDQPADIKALRTQYPILWKIFEPISERAHSIAFNKNPSDQEIKTALEIDPFNYRLLDNPTESAKEQYIMANGYNIKDIENPSEKLKKLAIEINPFAISNIENPSDELQFMAVNKSPNSIDCIFSPSYKLQTLAVTKDGMTIRFLRNPSTELIHLALKQNSNAIRYVKNPTPEQINFAIKQDGAAIKWIKNPSYELQKKAVESTPYAIASVEQTPELKKIALSKNGNALSEIKRPTPEDYKLAISTTPRAITLIPFPGKELLKMAIEKDPTVIQYINTMHDDLYDYAQRLIKERGLRKQ